eukprot:jgi/Chrzof1/12106/Cz06g21170.t1
MTSQMQAQSQVQHAFQGNPPGVNANAWKAACVPNSRVHARRHVRPFFSSHRSKSCNTSLFTAYRSKPSTCTVCYSARTTPAGKTTQAAADIEGPSTDLAVIYKRLWRLALPYWTQAPEARWKLAGVVALTLGTTGVSVMFNFLGRDFFNALSEKDADRFTMQLMKYLAGFCVGIPVFVFKGYYQSRLSLQWREWMTRELMQQYFADRSFYQLQAAALIDNPDQRIANDIRTFTDTALSLSLTLLNSLIDLVSFSGILYSIYPPLFGALLAYSIGGTLGSIALGKNLVKLNFNQEAREADMRYSLVRVRENVESIAFYGGESSEMAQIMQRLRAVVSNYGSLLIASRNLDFFTSFYRFLIQLLPAAVVAPLFFSGKIEFGVINQSQSAFNHILNDVSLFVYQFEALAGFSAVVDRLGEFQEVVDDKLRHEFTHTSGSSATKSDHTDSLADMPSPEAAQVATAMADGKGVQAPVVLSGAQSGMSNASASSSTIQMIQVLEDTGSISKNGRSHGNGQPTSSSSTSNINDKTASCAGDVLLELQGLSITTPDGSLKLVQDLSYKVHAGRPLLIMGPSGAGKTSLLRTLAGLWQSGSGTIYSYGLPGLGDPGCQPGSVLFLPQKPYMILGSLRDQLLYPTWSERHYAGQDGTPATAQRPLPSEAQLQQVLHTVQLSSLLDRCAAANADGIGLDHVADWSQLLSLGEQQRLAFARLLLAAPRLALLDEATSALDTKNETLLYKAVLDAGVTVISVGHRPSLVQFHQDVLQLGPNHNGTPGPWQVGSAEEMRLAATSQLV